MVIEKYGKEFVRVSGQVFFATVGSTNVHPQPLQDFTNWIDLDTLDRAIIGFSDVGFKNTWRRTQYYVEKATLDRLQMLINGDIIQEQ